MFFFASARNSCLAKMSVSYKFMQQTCKHSRKKGTKVKTTERLADHKII